MTGAAQQFLGTGTQFVNPTSVLPAVSAFQNPYTKCVVEATQRAMNQQNAQQMSQLQGCAIMKGAYGGDRAGIARGNLAYQQDLANQQTLAGLYCKNYSQALAAAQQQQGVCLAAQQANRAAQQYGAQQAGALGQQQYNQVMGVGTGLSALGQQQYGQNLGTGAQIGSLGNQAFTQGLGASQAQAGIGQNIYGNAANAAGLYQGAGNNIANTSLNAGNAYAGLGLQNQAAQLAAAQAQMQAGLVCQQTEQAKKTAMYNQFQQQQGYPFQTASAVANTAEATGAASGSTSTGTTHSSSGFASGGAVNRPGKFYGGGLGVASQGGAVLEPGAYARGGFDAGGTPGDSYAQSTDGEGNDFWINSNTGQRVSDDDSGLKAFLANGQNPVNSTQPAATTSAATACDSASKQNAQYENLINKAYGGIGRSGIGSSVYNIDQTGHDYWLNQLKSGAISPDQFNSAFNKNVGDYVSANPNDNYAKYINAYASTHCTPGGFKGTMCSNQAYYNMTALGPSNTSSNGFNTAGFKPVLCGDVIKYQCPNNPNQTYTSAQLAAMSGTPPCIAQLKGGKDLVYNPNLFGQPTTPGLNQYGMATGTPNARGLAGQNQNIAAYNPTRTQCAFLSGLGNLFSSYQPQQQQTYMPQFNFGGMGGGYGGGCGAGGGGGYANMGGMGSYGNMMGGMGGMGGYGMPQANIKGTSSMGGYGMGFSPYQQQQYTQQQYQPQTMAPPMYNNYNNSYCQGNNYMRGSAQYGQPSIYYNPNYGTGGYCQQRLSGGPVALATEQAQASYGGGATGQYGGNWACNAGSQASQMAATGQTSVAGASTAKPFAAGGRAGFALAGAVNCPSQYGCDRVSRMALGAINPYAPNAGGGYASAIPTQYIPRYGLQPASMPAAKQGSSGLAMAMQLPTQAASALESLGKLKTAGTDAYKWATTPSEKARGGRMGFSGSDGSVVPCCCSYVTNKNLLQGYGGQPYGAVAKGSPQAPNSKCGYVMPGLAPNPWSHIQPLKSAAPPAAPTPQNPLQTATKLASTGKTLADLPKTLSSIKSGLGGLFEGSQAANAATLDNALGSGFYANNISLGGAGAGAAAPGATSAGLGAAGSAAPLAETATAAAAPVAEAGLGTIGAEAAAPAIASSLAPEMLAGAAVPEAAGKGIAAMAPMLLAARGGAINGYARGGFIPRKRFADGGPEDTPAADLPSENANETIANGLPPGVSEAEVFGKKDSPQQSNNDLVEDYLQRTIQRESRNNPIAQSTTSSAGGLGQVINSTARSWLDKNGVPYDPKASHIAASLPTDVQLQMNRDLIKGHIDALGRNGLEPSYGNVTMAHFLGDAGGPAFVKNMMANPDAPATSFATPKAASANQPIFFKNGQPRTAQEVYNLMEKANGGGGAGAGGGGRSAMAYAPIQGAVSGASDAIKSAMNTGSDTLGGLGNFFTENKSWILPILAGLGSAGEASGKGYGKGSSIFAGLGGFANSYGNMQAQQATILKNTMDMANTRFVMDPTSDPANPMWRDTLKGGMVNGQQRFGEIAAAARQAGVVIPANATPQQVAAAASGAQPATGAAAANAPAAAGTTAVKPTTGDKTVTAAGDTPQTGTVSVPKEAFANVADEFNPYLLMQRAEQERVKAANATKLGAETAARAAEQQANAYKEQASKILNGDQQVLDKNNNPLVIPEIQANLNKKKSDAKFLEDQAGDKSKLYTTANQNLSEFDENYMHVQQLAHIFQNAELGRGSSALADLIGLARRSDFITNLIGPEQMEKLTAAQSAGDEGKKLATASAFQKIRDANSQRAPASALKAAIDTVANPDMAPNARQSLLTAQLTTDFRQRDLYAAWVSTAEKTGVPSDYGQFAKNWKNDPAHSMDNYYQNAKKAVGEFKGITPSEKVLQLPSVTDINNPTADAPKTESATPKTETKQLEQPTVLPPQPGEVRGGYRFKGGNYRDKNNYEKVQ
jgi:hypothetical protein